MGIYENINRQPTLQERRKFGFMLMIGFPIAGLIWLSIVRLSSSTWHPSVFYVFSLIGLSVGGFCALLPHLSRPIYVGWHLFGRSMEFILSYSLLALFFFLILTPFGWLKRTFGYAGRVRAPDDRLQQAQKRSFPAFLRLLIRLLPSNFSSSPRMALSSGYSTRDTVFDRNSQ